MVYNTLVVDTGFRKNALSRICVFCGKGFHVGDKIIVHVKKKVDYYHDRCWLDLNR